MYIFKRWLWLLCRGQEGKPCDPLASGLHSGGQRPWPAWVEAGKMKRRNRFGLSFYCKIDTNAERLDFGGNQRWLWFWAWAMGKRAELVTEILKPQIETHLSPISVTQASAGYSFRGQWGQAYGWNFPTNQGSLLGHIMHYNLLKGL